MERRLLVLAPGVGRIRLPGRRFVGSRPVWSDDPIVKGREHLFVPAEDSVEAATAAPGEKRNTRRLKKEASHG